MFDGFEAGPQTRRNWLQFTFGATPGGKAPKADFMPPFLYRCPNTGRNVQGFAAEEVRDDADTFEQVTCLACRQVHFVNPGTGKVLGETDDG